MDRAPAPGGRRLLAFGAIWALCCLGIAGAIHAGRGLAAPPRDGGPAAEAAAPGTVPGLHPQHGPGASPWYSMLDRPAASLGRLALQLVVILLATRTVGSVFRAVGLPSVVGEITAGVLLGPSMLGWLWPGGFGFIFSGASLDPLRLLSQIGVTVFMFAVGMELEVGDLGRRARSAFLVSQTGILVPFLLGTASALFLYPRYAGPGTGFTSFALFMGIAMSITAFPVLVRILEDRGMAATPLGVAAITCAAVGDASAWAVLALVVAFARAEAMTATLFNIALLAVFVAFMLAVVRRLLPRWLGQRGERGGMPGPGIVAASLAVMAGSALITGVLGIHALFGAFLAGAVMPRHESFRLHLAARLEGVTRVLFMPLFFAFSGLRTHIGLLNDPTGWLVCLAIVGVATVGKLGSSMVAARMEGMGWSDAFSFGALMNTRGLMELIALNIGYDLGVLQPPIFTMLVLMALITTFLTGPLLALGGMLGSRAGRGCAGAGGVAAP
jgi:Kef-type K+ transport system membrane component KefB